MGSAAVSSDPGCSGHSGEGADLSTHPPPGGQSDEPGSVGNVCLSSPPWRLLHLWQDCGTSTLGGAGSHHSCRPDTRRRFWFDEANRMKSGVPKPDPGYAENFCPSGLWTETGTKESQSPTCRSGCCCILVSPNLSLVQPVSSLEPVSSLQSPSGTL